MRDLSASHHVSRTFVSHHFPLKKMDEKKMDQNRLKLLARRITSAQNKNEQVKRLFGQNAISIFSSTFSLSQMSVTEKQIDKNKRNKLSVVVSRKCM